MFSPADIDSLHDIELRYLGRVWQGRDRLSTWSFAAGLGQSEGPTQFRSSYTALSTALMRAAHSRLDAEPLFDDTWGDRLVPAAARAAFLETALAAHAADGVLPAALTGSASLDADAVLDAALRAASGYTNVVVRTRFTEDALRLAVARGVDQYVIIGAGFDSFGLRQPSFARHVEVFEVDHPTPQSLKRRQVTACGVRVPRTLHWVAADLAVEDLAAALARSAYAPGKATFFAWLGVTMFLSREANRAVLRAIASCSPAGSELVFTYFDQRIFDASSAAFEDLRDSVRVLGEAFKSAFDHERLPQELRSLGFELLEDVDEAALLRRYGRADGSGMAPLAHSRIARARVVHTG
jgi:methyltransferase (TIGR00027 family)